MVNKGLSGIYLLLLIVIQTGCYRHPNLNGETIGSFSGAVGGGLFAASQAGGNLIFIGAGSIAGSIFGGVIGSAFDNEYRLHIADPALWPIVMDCYKTRRPTYMAAYCPGIAIPPDSPYLYVDTPWANYPNNF